MPVYVALLRGINVGGISLPMTDLVSILQDLGCRNVKTYIQSGNAFFLHPSIDPVSLSAQIGAEIEPRRGFKPAVLLLTLAEIESAIAANPFTEAAADPSKLHLGFLGSIPANPNLQALEKLKAPGERFQLIGKVFYFHAPDGVGRSKLAAGEERLLGVTLTDRNWNTVLKMEELARALV